MLWVLFGERIIVRAQSVVPEAIGHLLVGATLLGEAWLFVVVLTLALWFGDARRIAPLFGLVFGGLALVLVLKTALGIPRPVTGPLLAVEAVHPTLRPGYAWAIGGSGYGFPSGHVAGATIAWGGLAAAVGVGTRRGRWLIAAAIVALVGTSRVLLGVHFVADVIGGLILGIGLVVLYQFLVRYTTAPGNWAFASGLVFAVAAIATEPSATDPYLAAGALGGGLFAWVAFADHDVTLSRTMAGTGWALVGVVVIGVAGGIIGTSVPGRAGLLLATMVMAAVILTWPTLVSGGPFTVRDRAFRRRE